jgi:hypothetical protein
VRALEHRDLLADSRRARLLVVDGLRGDGLVQTEKGRDGAGDARERTEGDMACVRDREVSVNAGAWRTLAQRSATRCAVRTLHSTQLTTPPMRGATVWREGVNREL